MFAKFAISHRRNAKRASKLAALLRREDGSQVVEMALSTMLLMGLMVGLIEFGFVMYALNTTADAARDATHWASVRGVDCDNPNITDGTCPIGGASSSTLQTGAQNLMSKYPFGNGLTVTINWCDSAGNNCQGSTVGNVGQMVQATVSYQFLTVPFISSNALSVSSSSQSVIW